ncbi:hypothetical protein OPV22_003869 [Ensete ventricosum]|uniref:Uncharacterized protein n=1 Tax=Ensete ventricosum TaxID=4639 RepID=A0AAV8S1U0_ENSVE|nr:hypothetical protein OPV22_003869 [Ensete ventricosum]
MSVMAVCVRYALETCTASGYLRGKSSNCSDPDCCKDGAMYPQYRCSPPVTADTTASMTIVTFAASGDGQYHSDDQMLVSLSTGWYDGGSRCNKNITINANELPAAVRRQRLPRCGRKALAIPEAQIGYYDVTWSDARL